jgi:hypothetical protein
MCCCLRNIICCWLVGRKERGLRLPSSAKTLRAELCHADALGAVGLTTAAAAATCDLCAEYTQRAHQRYRRLQEGPEPVN